MEPEITTRGLTYPRRARANTAMADTATTTTPATTIARTPWARALTTLIPWDSSTQLPETVGTAWAVKCRERVFAEAWEASRSSAQSPAVMVRVAVVSS